jgi:arginyl-tRNA synthetase
MTPEQLAAAIRHAVSVAVAEGAIALEPGQIPDEVTVERPRNPEHGDYATNIALQLAKPAGVAPRVVAEAVAGRLAQVEGVEKVDIAGPGFLNITLEAASLGEVARSAVVAGEAYGTVDTYAGTRVNVEFISANPTGPLHLGHTRWAAVGDAIARVLEAAGAEAAREFYINDRGVQMDKFGQSLEARALGTAVPDGGYQGAYIDDLAQQIVAAEPTILELGEPARWEAFRERGYELQLQQQKDVLDNFNTHFDVWYSERTLHSSGAEADGALWLRTTDFGDDKDRVLVKADGELTYFAATPPTTSTSASAASTCASTCSAPTTTATSAGCARWRPASATTPTSTLEVLIGQLVNLVKDGEPVRMSKRAGNVITLEDLVDEVGVDAARYALIRYPVDSPIDLDLDLLGPAHQRQPGLLRAVRARPALLAAAQRGRARDRRSRPPTSRCSPRARGDAARRARRVPAVVASAAELREPHRVARYLEELAGTYHRFYDACRVLPQGDEPSSPTSPRPALAVRGHPDRPRQRAGLLGVSAPERMCARASRRPAARRDPAAPARPRPAASRI